MSFPTVYSLFILELLQLYNIDYYIYIYICYILTIVNELQQY